MDGADDGESVPFSLPTGVVTFLLTDIEASSQAWEADADEMGPAVARHYEILDEAVAGRGGVRPVEQGEGDSIVAAFSRASDAIAAALAAQSKLRAELGDNFRVRMALHTGEAQLRDEGNYFGQAVIRCARLRACGHGGQILVSHTTADLVADRLPDGAGLQDLGEHRLKDLQRPERVFELAHDDLPEAGNHPALLSLDARRHNLPVLMTPLFGRGREIAAVIDLVERERMVTLTGTGGCGKTRLAGEVGARMIDEFPGGVWWCELAPRHDDGAVLGSLAAALGIAESPSPMFAVDVARRIAAGGPTLVVLDNAEHILDAVATTTVHLLTEAPELHVLVTSREPLGIPGEVASRVPSLAVPPSDAPQVVDQVAEFAAVGLFVERAARSRAGFALTDENAGAVAAICRRLDGIPLAIELAAARVRTLAPERIAAQLDDRFRLLTGGARTLLPRQQTLLASVAWSEALLDEPERRALRRLGVFVGGFTLEAAESVLGAFDDTDPYEVLDIVGRLVDKSLVVFDETLSRYRMLETIRSFALARLLDAGEGDATRDAHLAWAIADATEHDVRQDPGSLAWFLPFDREWPNFAAALEWANDRPEERCALVAALGVCWVRGQKMVEAISYGLDTIERFASDPPPSWYRAVANASPAIGNAGMADRIAPHTAAAAAIARAVGDEVAVTRLEFRVLLTRLMTEGLDNDLLGAVAEIADRAERVGDSFTRSNARMLPAQFLAFAGRIDEAFLIPFPPPRRHRYALIEAHAAMLRGDFDRAEMMVREGLELAAVEAEQERVGAAGYAALWEALTGRSLDTNEVGVEAADSAAYIGIWAVMHISTTVRRAMRDKSWHEIEQMDGYDPSWRITGLRVEADLVPALVAAGRRDQAAARARTLLATAERMHSPLQEIEARLVLSELEESAEQAYAALALAERYGLILAQVDALELVAVAAVHYQDLERAARLKAAALAERERIGYVFRWPTRDAPFEAIVVPDGTPADSLDDAVAYAQRGRGDRRRPAFGWESLTPTELDVAMRVASGSTNRQVAESLHVGIATVKTHLIHIYSKLGINSRAELAAEVTRREATD